MRILKDVYSISLPSAGFNRMTKLARKGQVVWAAHEATEFHVEMPFMICVLRPLQLQSQAIFDRPYLFCTAD